MDLHHFDQFDANPDPSIHIDADAYPTFNFDVDPDTTDPDTVPHQSYEILRLLVNRLHFEPLGLHCERLRPSIAPF